MSRAVCLSTVPSLLLLLCACATTTAAVAPTSPADAGAAAPTEAELRAQVQAMFEREAPVGPSRRFTLDGTELEVESTTEVTVEQQEGVRIFKLGLGSASPVVCRLLGENFDTGGTLAQVLAAWKKAGLQFAPLRPFELEVIEGSPALFLDVGYLAQQAGRQARGEAQLMYYPSDTAPLVCLHDEPGYAKSFHRVVATAVAAVARARPPEKTSYRQVDAMRLQDQVVGFATQRVLRRPEGGAVTVSVSAMVMPRGPSEWQTSDEVMVSTGARDGTLTERRMAAFQNGEVQRDLTLKRAGRGVYRYEGTVQGKALNGELKPAGGKDLLDDLAQARLFRTQLLGGKQKVLRFEDYIPAATPVALTPQTFTRGAGPGEVAMEAGPLKAQLVLDAQGIPERLTMAIGPATLVQARLWAEGALP